jgi:ribosomal protein S18 acetylase RimI-like enzyme
MRSADIPFAVRLSDQEKWGTVRYDLERILQLNPRGSFVALKDQSKVGIITTVAFGRDLAWIGNVIVDKKYRGKHIGQGLVKNALSYLQTIRVKTIGLYCFANNAGFYERLGFVRDAEFVRLRRNPKVTDSVAHEKKALPPLSQLLAMDKKCFGANRSRLLRALIVKGHGKYLGFSHGRSAAYLVVKKYEDMCDFGPWIGVNASRAELSELLNSALRRTWNKPIELSCLAGNRVILDLLRQQSFRVVDGGYRMFFNRGKRLGSDRANYLLGFLDKG